MIRDIIVAAALGATVLPLYETYRPQKYPAVEVQAVDTPLVSDATIVSILFKGPIMEDTDTQIEGAIKDTFNRGQAIAYLLLSSGGGSGHGGRRLGKMLRKYPDLTIFIDSECKSACGTAALLSGPSRIILGPYARIGLHQSADPDTGRPMMEWTYLSAQLLREAGIPQSVVNGLMNTPPSGMYWLKEKELIQMNVKGRYVIK